MSFADISIVIPCYNSGKFLPETLESIKSYTGNYTYEVIIVDDGSTNTGTLTLLQRLKEAPGIKIISQKNGGPAAARNTGVRNASADFILFVDSDNKIRANAFIDKGVAVLKNSSEVGVFYGDPAYFGAVTEHRVFKKGPYNTGRMLRYNYIDMCSIVRKKTWEDVGGLDENRLIMGHEDWDFWLRIGRTNWKFYYLEETLFDYRVLEVSMVTQATSSSSYHAMINYVLSKQADLLPVYFVEALNELKAIQSIRKNEISHPFRTFVKSLLIKTNFKKSDG